MAGLLDSLTAALGGEGLDTNGKSALNQGLLTMGLSMLASPGKFGQQLGQGGLQGMQAYQGAQQNQQRKAYLDQQMAAAKAEADMNAWKFTQTKADAERQQKIRDLAPQFMQTIPPAQMAIANGGPTPGNAAAIPTTAPGQAFDYRGYANAMAQYDPEAALKLQQAFTKPVSKVQKVEQMTDPATNKLVNVATFEDGSTKVLPFGVKPEMVQTDLGNRFVWQDKNSVAPGAAQVKGATPDAQLSSSTTRRGQDMTDARARDLNAITKEGQQTQIVQDSERGPMLINKATGLARPAIGINGQPVVGEAAAKRTMGADSLVPVLDEAKALVKDATGSYLGAGWDMGAAAFGSAPTGALAIAKLKVLEGKLMMNQPRMEGPQSDKDVSLYRQMAGQIGDPTVPQGIKLAALETIEMLNQKYVSSPRQGAQQPKKAGGLPPGMSVSNW